MFSNKNIMNEAESVKESLLCEDAELLLSVLICLSDLTFNIHPCFTLINCPRSHQLSSEMKNRHLVLRGPLISRKLCMADITPPTPASELFMTEVPRPEAMDIKNLTQRAEKLRY